MNKIKIEVVKQNLKNQKEFAPLEVIEFLEKEKQVISKEEFIRNISKPVIHNNEDLFNFAYSCYLKGVYGIDFSNNPENYSTQKIIEN